MDFPCGGILCKSRAEQVCSLCRDGTKSLKEIFFGGTKVEKGQFRNSVRGVFAFFSKMAEEYHSVVCLFSGY